MNLTRLDELSRLASLDGISDWNPITVDPESTDVEEVDNLWPMMDPLMDNKTDMKPLMLRFNLDSDSQTLTMLDSIANSIKLETPDADDFLSLPCSMNNSALSASDIVTSMSMGTFATGSHTNTPTVVSVGTTHKMTPVHSSSNGSKSPQCKVCNDESSGFHYGVDSCEGCKGFFRRCITQGMTHKCSNNEKCEITPFTRNSCQYCRLKKCFSVGMSREASRLGRRPKKLKDPNAENARSHTGNVPIAPYPTPAEVHLIRMAELQRLLQANGTYKTELMQAFLSVQTSLQEQYGSAGPVPTGPVSTGPVSTSTVPAFINSTMVTSQSSTSETGLRTLASPPVNTGQACSSASKPMANVPPMNCDPANPPNIRGLESGYSSMNSPGSSKSQSPIQYSNLTNNNVGQMQPISEGMFAMDNGNGILQNDNNINLMLPPGMHLDTNIANMFGQSQQAGGGKNMMSTMVHTAMENTGPQNSMPVNLPQSPLSQPGSSGTPVVSKLAGVDRIVTYVRQPAMEERRVMLQKVTETIVCAHLNTCRITHENVGIAIQSSPILRDENESDIADNSIKMWNQFVENMVNEITSVVTFCKRLPGFIEICQDDQIHLIKQGSFECFFARFSMLVDCNNGQMLDPLMAYKCSRKIVSAMPMGDFFAEFFGVADLLNPLGLTDGEIGLFASVLVMCPDRTDLKNKKTIGNLQGLFYQALYLLIKENHMDGEELFERLLNTIPKLRDINNQHCMALNNIKMKAPEKVEEFPDLHQEVFFENSDAL